MTVQKNKTPALTQFVTLTDVFSQPKEYLVPREPISLYRYVELLVQLTLLKKYRSPRILETGPGTYPVFGQWPGALYDEGAVVDYSEKVLSYCERALADKNIDRILLDFDRSGALSALGRKWDLIVSNGVLEHLRADRDHVRDMYDALAPGGFLVCVTVLNESLFNDWDRAVGHYRRYSVRSLMDLFKDFSGVQLIQTSFLQEVVRPLFFGRIRHLVSNTPEQNNRMFGDEVTNFSRPPYSGVFGIVRWLLPAYLCFDWVFGRFLGGIGIVIARKES